MLTKPGKGDSAPLGDTRNGHLGRRSSSTAPAYCSRHYGRRGPAAGCRPRPSRRRSSSGVQEVPDSAHEADCSKPVGFSPNRCAICDTLYSTYFASSQAAIALPYLARAARSLPRRPAGAYARHPKPKKLPRRGATAAGRGGTCTDSSGTPHTILRNGRRSHERSAT